MELAARRMACRAWRLRLNGLIFEMALAAGEGRHRRVGRARVAGGALRHQTSSSQMTLVAAELGVLLLERPRMPEFFRHLDVGRPGDFALLGDDGMAELAILANHLPFLAHMLPLVTAEAAREQGMADIVRMGPPVHLHLEIGRAHV